jgi:hypothetical protein
MFSSVGRFPIYLPLLFPCLREVVAVRDHLSFTVLFKVTNCDHICGLQTDTVSIVEKQWMSGEMEVFTWGLARCGRLFGLFGLFGLSGFFGVRHETNEINETNQIAVLFRS